MSFTHINTGSLLAPTPVVMVSCSDRDKNFNIITIAWVGVVNSKPPMLSISVTPERYSYGMLMDTKEFVVNFVSEELVKFADFCGVKSGREINKFKACGLTSIEVEELKYAPAIDETPIFMACSVREIIQLPSHTMFIAEVMGVYAKDYLFDENGRVDFKKAKLVSYQHGEYYATAEKLGFFGYSIATEEVLKRRMGK
jgi:flavin reductase (DIM6/NTAB) family NADH-FMN oxidoreductase RutF